MKSESHEAGNAHSSRVSGSTHKQRKDAGFASTIGCDVTTLANYD